MTKPQSPLSGVDRCESYNGCSVPSDSTTYSENCNTGSVSSQPSSASDSLLQPASGSRRRKRNSAFSLEAEFWAHVDRTGDCWLWTGKTLKRNGYGYLWHPEEGRTIHAHRVSWLVHHGAIPDRLHVLHRCDVPVCLNPAHLFLGTQLDNMRDMAAKGRRSPDAHTRKGVKFTDAHRAALSAAQRRRHAKKRKVAA